MNEHDSHTNKKTQETRRFQEESPLQLQPSDVVEVPLLLSTPQMLALEAAAYDRGMTAGEMVRRLLQEFISGPTSKGQAGPRKAAAG
jgi:hypothetical protein